MRWDDSMEHRLGDLRYEATAERRRETLRHVLNAMDERQEERSAPSRLQIWRATMKTKTTRLALAAVVILMVLGGVTFWPLGRTGETRWWDGPPAAWGQYVAESLEKVSTLVYREGCVFVGDYGSTHISGNWSRWYKAADRRRRDRYYEDELVSTMWEVPDGAGSVLRYDVSYEYECYTAATYEAPAAKSDPVELLRFYVNLLDRADRVLDAETFAGKECVGFEISASKYGSNPEHWIDRIWFDTETKLPVRIEKHGRPVTNHPEETFTFVQDQFEYWIEVPLAEFDPQIPEDFANTHPDNVRTAREVEEKGEMVFADVPEGVKDDLVAALDQGNTVAYRERGHARFHLSRHAWRKDHFDGDRLRKTEWFVIEKDDMAPTSLDFNDKNFRLVHTVVDYDAQTYEQVTHGRDTRPRHPMDRIRFLVGWVDRADRILENKVIDEIECFGFELSAKKYGSNPDHMIHRLWFDVATNLPVRMEFESVSESSGRKSLHVKDQFDWNPEFPADYFVPEIPPGFTLAETEGE